MEAASTAAAATAAAAAAAADHNAVLQAISSFLCGNPLLRDSALSFCKVAGVLPLEALRAMRAAAIAGASTTTVQTPLSAAAAALLSTLLSHCDLVHPLSSLAFSVMSHILPGDISLSPPSSPSSSSSSFSTAASLSGCSNVSSMVVERALCHHSKSDCLPSFSAMLALMESVGLIKRFPDATLTVPQVFLHASASISASSEAASSSLTILLSVASALQETFWFAAAPVSPVARASHFLQLAYTSTSSAAAIDAACSLLPRMEESLARLRDVADRTSQNDDVLHSMAGVIECVAAAHGIMAGNSSSMTPPSASSVPVSPSSSNHLDLQISFLTECVSLKEKCCGPHHYDMCRPLLSLAVAFLHRAAAGDSADVSKDHSGEDASIVAQSLLERALGLQETKFGSGHVEVCQRRHNAACRCFFLWCLSHMLRLLA
jgi:hypothetical protein